MKPQIKIRPAIPDDAEGITRVRIDTWKSNYRGIVPDNYLDSMQYEEEAKRRKGYLTGLSPNSAKKS